MNNRVQVVAAVCLVLAPLGACSGAPEENATSAIANDAAPEAPAKPTKLAENDINNTMLPDINYANQGWLEARRRGLAAESVEDADPAKVGKIDPIAIDPYTRAEYPDVVRQWGKLIPTINRERKRAAQLAAKDPRCDGVDNAQITDHGTRSNRHYMTECNNLTRIYFDSISLEAGRPAVVRTQADMGAQGVLDY